MAGSPRVAVPLAALVCGLGLALAGCGASSPAPSSTAAAPATVTVTASAPAAAASAATPAAAGKNSGCPSAPAVSAAAGTAYLPPQAETRSGALDCTYQGNSTLLLISLATSEFPASDLREVVANQPTGAGVKLTTVRGIGDAAFMVTFPGAAQAGGPELIVQSGSREVCPRPGQYRAGQGDRAPGPGTVTRARAAARERR
ncbi:MAG TPA: hypothetical protein VFX25_07830 [Streptosporangiaceae bacterium]|nr:hypothetical protein [Streptosporangiaceae bacterium]